MLTLKLIRKVVKILRGGAGTREIFLGMLLGIILGMIPGLQGLSLAVTFVILLLNANIGFTLLGLAIGKVLCYALAMVSFQLGYILIQEIGLSFFQAIQNTPILALLGFDNYSLVGGLPLSIIIGIIAGKIFASMVTKIREQMIQAGEQKHIAALLEKKWAKFLIWATFGKAKVPMEEVLNKESALFRKAGIIFAGIIVTGILVIQFFLAAPIMKKGIISAIQTQTGAEVNISTLHFSPLEGELEILNLEIADPQKLTHNLIQTNRIYGKISVSDLLRKRFLIEKVEITQALLERERANKALIIYPEVVEVNKQQQAEVEVDEDPLALGVTVGELEDYFKQGKELKEKLRQFAEYLSSEEPEAFTDPNNLKEQALLRAEQEGYLNVSATNLAKEVPRILLNELIINEISVNENWSEMKLQAKNISSHPYLTSEPTPIYVKQIDKDEEIIFVQLNLHQINSNHELKINLKNHRLNDLIKLSDKVDFKITQGRVNLTLNGLFSPKSLNLPYKMVISELAIEGKGEEIYGLNADIVIDTIAAMDTLTVDGEIAGSMYVPKVHVNTKELQSELEKAAKDAGKKILVNKANEELDRATEKLEEKHGEKVDKYKNKLKNYLDF
ncbi:MAG: hypothetical protein MK193_00720 [Lentisphaeria bacterium]|nr:hypothetical protein [Lentisphaeria bacterium]